MGREDQKRLRNLLLRFKNKGNACVLEKGRIHVHRRSMRHEPAVMTIVVVICIHVLHALKKEKKKWKNGRKEGERKKEKKLYRHIDHGT